MNNIPAIDGTVSGSEASSRPFHHLTVKRRLTQIAFIPLIFLLPVLDTFRYDSAGMNLIVFGKVLSLGLKEGAAFYRKRLSGSI